LPCYVTNFTSLDTAKCLLNGAAADVVRHSTEDEILNAGKSPRISWNIAG